MESEPGGQYSLENLKDIMIAKTFGADEKDLGPVLDFFESMAEVLGMIVNEKQHPAVCAGYSIIGSPSG